MNLRIMALLTLLLVACGPAETPSTETETPDSSGDGNSPKAGETTSDTLAG